MTADMTADYISTDRARFVSEPPTGSGRGDFERDRARVLHSAALRRLAAKTQVMGLGAGDFPRTRLTHSLECAQIGREIAGSLGADPDLIDAACLAHDLGHPPFGHNGEAALDEIAAACGGFEGNAQSFRVLTRLEAKVHGPRDGSVGLNLTRATLDAATKYPWPRRAGVAKWGVYADDLAIFEWVRTAAGAGQCVEAQIMDWSDDVAYSVHDLEDGVHAGHVPLHALGSAAERESLAELAAADYSDLPHADLTAAARRLWELPVWLREFDGTQPALAALKAMTSTLIGRLCQVAIASTRAAAGGRPLRRYQGQFVVPEEIRAECAVLKAVAARFVMARDDTRREQARQREWLHELADALALNAPEVLEPWLRAAWRAAADDAARARVVVDQLASLTDTSALALHGRLVG